MGLDYSYEIITPAQNVAGALVELAKLAPAGRRVPPLTVTLPGGDQVVVPFTSHFDSEPVDCSSGSRLELDTDHVRRRRRGTRVLRGLPYGMR
ncbi:hypothetical protein ABZZ37_16375 [Streptomyces sp. NPDC006464]|uniref:hypothetical protein n=1 Tax=Streptomyces sp. NPDC006464 TaxID=3154305 RepID=UPI0033A8C9BA